MVGGSQAETQVEQKVLASNPIMEVSASLYLNSVSTTPYHLGEWKPIISTLSQLNPIEVSTSPLSQLYLNLTHHGGE